MTHWFLPKWTVALVGVVSLMSWLANPGWCASRHGQVPLELRQSYPPSGPYGMGCAPNVRNFGHYRTSWRQWPGEPHPSQTNHRSLGAEVIPTPMGQEEVPLPKATMPREPQPELWKSPAPQNSTESLLPPPPQAMPSQPLIPLIPLIPLVPEEQPTQTKPPEAARIVPPEGLLIPKKPIEELLDEPTQARPSRPPSGESLPSLPTLPLEPESSPPKEDKTDAAKPEKSPRLNPTSPVKDAFSQLGKIKSRYDRHVEPAGYVVTEAPPVPVAQRPAMPRVALEGFCPVALGMQGRWAPGDLRWTVVHKGWIYRLSGDDQRRQFLADPDRFAPAFSCNDPVFLTDRSQAVSGQVAYCAQYDGRLYMFATVATQARFNKNPQRYAAVE